LELVIGAQEENFMKTKKNVIYTNEPIGKVKIIKDFLPSPDKLALKKETFVKVTLLLSEESVNYFKHEAEKHHSHYQTMMRNLLDGYAKHHQQI